MVKGGLLSDQRQGEPADYLNARNVMHHLPDFWKAMALRRIASMMNTGGVLLLRDLVFSFDPAETEAAIEAWLAGAVESAAARWTRAELEQRLRTEYSTFRWPLEPMPERMGFAMHRAEIHAAGIYVAYVCGRE